MSYTISFGNAPQNQWGHLGWRNSCDRSYLNGAVIACGELHVERVLPVAIGWIGKITTTPQENSIPCGGSEVDVFRPKGAPIGKDLVPVPLHGLEARPALRLSLVPVRGRRRQRRRSCCTGSTLCSNLERMRLGARSTHSGSMVMQHRYSQP